MLCAAHGLCDTVCYMVYDPEDFRESMDDMCDDALRRMLAFQEGGLVVMQPGDAYYSEVLERDRRLETVEYDTISKAKIADMHENIVKDGLPDFAVHLGASAIIILARQAAYLGAGQSVIVPTIEMSQDEVRTELLVNESRVRERELIPIVTFQLGSRSIASLVLGPTDEGWELYYESHRRAVRFLSN